MGKYADMEIEKEIFRNNCDDPFVRSSHNWIDASRSVQCPNCGKMFQINRVMLQHIRNAHGNEATR